MSLAIWPSSAGADGKPGSRDSLAVRVSASAGWLEELTWAYPGVDIMGRVYLGAARRGFIELQLGYTPLDNHTFLADGRMARLGVSGGARISTHGALQLGATLALEKYFFHADPDVLAEHPGVDIMVSRSALVPVVGLRASYDLTDTLAVGVFGRTGVTDVTLFRENDTDPQTNGVATRARLLLFGLSAEFRIH